MIAKERELWENGSDEDIFVSRSKVAQSIRRFVSQIQVDFQYQTATIYVAGYTRIYVFNREGNLNGGLNATSLPFSEIEKIMRMDQVSEAVIAQAREAHATLQAAMN